MHATTQHDMIRIMSAVGAALPRSQADATSRPRSALSAAMTMALVAGGGGAHAPTDWLLEPLSRGCIARQAVGGARVAHHGAWAWDSCEAARLFGRCGCRTNAVFQYCVHLTGNHTPRTRLTVTRHGQSHVKSEDRPRYSRISSRRWVAPDVASTLFQVQVRSVRFDC
jgi:hypothetical protein